jgi:FkbM family methyltransferase
MLRRFRVARPYLASLIQAGYPRPPFREVVRWFLQPGREARAARHIIATEEDGEYLAVRFRAQPERVFYYPRHCRWVDLCEVVDECFSSANWHHYFSDEVRLSAADVVVDCGAAEGLFTFVASATARRVYAVEPVPTFLAALERNFGPDPNVTILPFAAGHRSGEVRMADDAMASRISGGGALVVGMRTLDDLLAAERDPITLIKGDVEGFEFPMLLGAEGIIRAHRPRVVLAVYHEQDSVGQIRDFLLGVHADYRFMVRGLAENGHPVVLRAF